MHMGGAIEAEDADKAARLMQLCNVHGLPIVPVRYPRVHGRPGDRDARPGAPCLPHVRDRLASYGPILHRVLRRGYGLGAMAMATGGFHESFFTASWPTGEFGGMGLEGAVKAGFRRSWTP